MRGIFKRISIVAVLLLVGATKLSAQSERDKIREIEENRQTQRNVSVRAELDSAIALTNAGKYEAADEKYRYVLQNLKSLPSDLTYHFGRNSYLLGQYSQSVDWLNKYIQLKGPSGQYYQDAVTWKEKAEQEVLKQREIKSAEATVILSKNYDIDCGPTGKVTCPVCSGSTVVIKKTYLGDSYKTCTFCKKLGYLSCEDYNKMLRGELKPNP
jgi:tetratricopeptide (TPR) repeat protein